MNPFQTRWASLVMLIGWIAFIFGTSCTVVRPQEFFDWTHKHVITDEEFYEQFRVFWGLSWFAIVKGWHVAEFAILQLLCVRFVEWWTGAVTRSSIVGCMMCCLVFAISDEWHQSFVQDRMGTITDVIIDSVGVLVMGLTQLRRIGKSP